MALGSVSLGALIAAGVLLAPSSAIAQSFDPLDCRPNSTGPVAGDATPFGGGACNLGALETDRSFALGVSRDGSTVIGTIGPASNRVGFKWTSSDGVTLFEGLTTVNPAFSGTSITSARAVSIRSDGTEIATGQSRNEVGRARAVRWIDGVIEDLGTLLDAPQTVTDPPDFSQSNAAALNADGTIAAGWSYYSGAANERRAMRWVEGGNFGGPNPEMQDLGVFGGGVGRSMANDVNAAGNVVVGIVGEDSFPRGFRWVEGGTNGAAGNPEMQDLGTFRTDGGGFSSAESVNDDGTIVVGISQDDNGDFSAYRWVENGLDGPAANPEMQDLGLMTSDQSGFSWAYGVNADGNVVVGYGTLDTGNTQAFRWVEGGDEGIAANPQMQSLGSLRSDNGGYSRAFSVNGDGSVVVGEAETDDGSNRAFIWRTQMQDFLNLTDSLPLLGNETEIAITQQNAALGLLMDETCLAREDEACLRVGGWLSHIEGTPQDGISSQTQGVGTLTYGRGISDQTTLGGTLSVSGTNLGANGFDMGAGVGVSLWAEHSEGGLARTGWQAGAAFGWGHESGDITRGLGLNNVMPARGDARLDTFGARALLGYGLQTQDWLVTPSATLSYFNTRRSGYSETGADFNASYEDLSIDRTTATLAVFGKRQISERDVFSVGLGLDHDLSVDRVMLTGTSAVPGLESFAAGSTLERDHTRGFFSLGLTRDLEEDRSLSGNLRIGEAAYGSQPEVAVGVHYQVRF